MYLTLSLVIIYGMRPRLINTSVVCVCVVKKLVKKSCLLVTLPDGYLFRLDWTNECAVVRLLNVSVTIYTVFRKKYPLTFSFISQCVMSRFKQKLQ